jgi:PemK-like, MazF-like toxin of type II toxin-antitoxin system
MYRKGDIVLVPFPFSDLTSLKTRPTVVINTAEFEKTTGNIIVAMVTSVPKFTKYDYEIRDWKASNLLSPSWIRIKIVIIEPTLVPYKPGKLSRHDLLQVSQKLSLALGF